MSKSDKSKIRCDELDPLVLKRIQSFVSNKDSFLKMLDFNKSHRRDKASGIEGVIKELSVKIAEISAEESNLIRNMGQIGDKGSNDLLSLLSLKATELKEKKAQLFNEKQK